MNRLLTKRDKTGSHRRSKSSEPGTKPRPLSGNGILSLLRAPDKKHGPDKKQEKEDLKKIQALKQRLRDNSIACLDETQIEYALQTKYAGGDVERAYEMLVLFQESVEGIVRPYDPKIHMLGAENRGAVTCYLDTLLFAMFARLGSFEPILYTQFEDEPRRRLSTLIRLWVNMLRSGKLIQTDITQHLQEALAACGWEEAGELCQQDTSEAFGFITEKLQLPLLTMEMDIFHEGKGDAADDHKLINERLLEVAIPQEAREGRPIRLEDCLEEYFNTRVEVVRRLDRRNTLQLANVPSSSLTSGLSTVDEKESTSSQHFEYAESPATYHSEPVTAEEKMHSSEQGENTDDKISRSMTPVQSQTAPIIASPPRRQRATSIIRHIVVTEESGEASMKGDAASTHSSMRKASLRKEVLMPAWQFFRIIPWYTAQIPTNDAQVAAHFSSTRPVLGICLKRYAMSPEGNPIRQNTAIDIPLQIALPHFIRDDNASEDGPLFGNFNLVLQSAVCHRGTSVHTGHYISIIRGTAKAKDAKANSSRRYSADSELPAYSEDQWIKFDDLAPERVTYVDIEKTMEKEMPYLLFYQVQPIFPDEIPEDLSNRPPSYQDSGIGMIVQEATPITTSIPDTFLASTNSSGYFDSPTTPEVPSTTRISFSDDADRPRKSVTVADGSRRGSLAFTDTSTTSIPSVPSLPSTPNEEAHSSRLSRAASRFGRRTGAGEKSKSRPTSHVDENRISATFSRLGLLASRSSKDLLNRAQDTSFSDVVVNAMALDGLASEDGTPRKDSIEKVDDGGEGLVASSMKPEATSTDEQPAVQQQQQQQAPSPLSNQDPKHKNGKGKHESKPSDPAPGGGIGSGGGSGSINIHHHHLHHHERGSGQKIPDRECTVM